ncbi:MAG: thioesterase family protein [Clostridia bacterium]|nr:thioesterase family protein [Clostridia bacterium]
MSIEAGIKNVKKITVTDEMTAARVGSGLLPVYATPQMAALMEQTAAESIETMLPEGCTTVGTKLNLSHLSADPVGMELVCESVLTAVDGRRFEFHITVSDSFGVVGECDHERFSVKRESFMAKTSAKLAK